MFWLPNSSYFSWFTKLSLFFCTMNSHTGRKQQAKQLVLFGTHVEALPFFSVYITTHPLISTGTRERDEVDFGPPKMLCFHISPRKALVKVALLLVKEI